MSGREMPMHWKVHVPNLLKEVMSNQGAWALSIPINIFARLLHDVAARASELNDPEMNKLMMRLTLYEIADPTSPAYDKTAIDEVMSAAA